MKDEDNTVRRLSVYIEVNGTSEYVVRLPEQILMMPVLHTQNLIWKIQSIELFPLDFH